MKEHRLGKGKVICGKAPGEVLTEMGLVADFYAPRSVSPWVNRIHRHVKGLDVYFIANSHSQPIEFIGNFRAKGMRPELWRPESGDVETVAVYAETGGVTSLPLRLDPSGSVFVVFRPGGAADPNHVVSVTRNGSEVLSTAAARVQANLALGAKVSASSTDRGHGYPPYSELRVNDGDRSTLVNPGSSWTNDVTAQMPQWLELDFQARKTFRTVELYTSGGYALKDFQIQCWDGEKWLAAGNRVSGNTEPHRTIVFPPVTASKLRVMCYSGPAHQTMFARINEIEVYEELPTPAFRAPTAQVTAAGDQFAVEVWQPGKYELKAAAGTMRRFEVAAMEEPLEIAGSWQLRFPSQAGMPKEVTLDRLMSWSAHSDAGIKYFSGAATYTKSIRVPARLLARDRKLLLDLGSVAVMAEVTLNGKSLGTLWKPPYCVDVSDVLKPGENMLEVKVVNLFVNRMIGDEFLPEDSDRNPDGTLKAWPKWVEEGKPSPARRSTFTTWRLWKKTDALQTSGLLGPVTLRTTVRRTLGPE